MFYFFGCKLLKLIDLNDYKTYNLVKYHLLFWIFDDSSIFILLLSGLMYFLCIEGGRKVRAELISYNISWYNWNFPHQQVNWYKNTMISSRLKYRPYRDHFGSTRVIPNSGQLIYIGLVWTYTQKLHQLTIVLLLTPPD